MVVYPVNGASFSYPYFPHRFNYIHFIYMHWVRKKTGLFAECTVVSHRKEQKPPSITATVLITAHETIPRSCTSWRSVMFSRLSCIIQLKIHQRFTAHEHVQSILLFTLTISFQERCNVRSCSNETTRRACAGMFVPVIWFTGLLVALSLKLIS